MSYYDTLYISKESTKEEIKAQYQKLTLDFHPDSRNGDNKLYLNIKEAFGVLSNKHTRDFYDFFGDSGIQLFTDSTLRTLYSRIFSLLALRILILSAMCSFIGFLSFPMLLFLMKQEMIKISFVHCQSIFLLSLLIFGCYVMKCFILLRKYEENEYTQMKLFMIAVFGKLLMFNWQLCFGFIIEDKLITKYMGLYILPYIILEAILLYEDYIDVMENYEEFEKKQKVLDVFIGLNVRIICFVAFCFDLDIKYKFLFPIAVVLSECLIRKVSKVIMRAVLLYAFIYFFCCYAALTKVKWIFFMLVSNVYVCLIFLLRYFYKRWQKMKPQCKFMKQKMIDDV